jgi:hypothetical protein
MRSENPQGQSMPSPCRAWSRPLPNARGAIHRAENGGRAGTHCVGATRTVERVARKGRQVTKKTAISNAEIHLKPKLRGKPFQKGKSANPAGRPRGSRNKLDESCVAKILEAFERGGAEAINFVMQSDPLAFLNLVAKILPRHIHQEVRLSAREMTDAELTSIAAGEGDMLN